MARVVLIVTSVNFAQVRAVTLALEQRKLQKPTICNYSEHQAGLGSSSVTALNDDVKRGGPHRHWRNSELPVAPTVCPEARDTDTPVGKILTASS